MSFQLSPGVKSNEVDLTNIIPAVSTSTGAYIGKFNWGPVNTPTLVTSQKELADKFGVPTENYEVSFFTAASFLNYSNALYVIRAGEASHENASDVPADNLSIGNSKEFDLFDFAGKTSNFFARYPGTWGNDIEVSVFDTAAFTTGTAKGSGSLTYTPGANELSVVVLKDDVVLEVFEVLSTVAGTKDETGASTYIADVINQKSKYVHLINPGTVSAGVVSLSGGVDGGTVGLVTAAEQLESEEIDVSLTFGENDTALNTKLSTIVASKKDFVAFVNGVKADIESETISTQSFNSSYVVGVYNYAKVYNQYADKYVWIPVTGHAAGLCAYTDDVAGPWWSPAGYNRGKLRGIVSLMFNPNKTQRDELYQRGWNPVISVPGEGPILLGDKTTLTRPSAFDRINVRRLFIVLRKAISRAAKYQLFEFNDEFTRAMFRNMVEPYLREIQGRRGLTDFYVVCDETNNTGEVIDRNEFVADIYLKPARSINFITLNFIATRTGVDFGEIVGLRS